MRASATLSLPGKQTCFLFVPGIFCIHQKCSIQINEVCKVKKRKIGGKIKVFNEKVIPHCTAFVLYLWDVIAISWSLQSWMDRAGGPRLFRGVKCGAWFVESAKKAPHLPSPASALIKRVCVRWHETIILVSANMILHLVNLAHSTTFKWQSSACQFKFPLRVLLSFSNNAQCSGRKDFMLGNSNYCMSEYVGISTPNSKLQIHRSYFNLWLLVNKFISIFTFCDHCVRCTRSEYSPALVLLQHGSALTPAAGIKTKQSSSKVSQFSVDRGFFCSL